jgi:DNA repair protein RecN (Recombination protein N)
MGKMIDSFYLKDFLSFKEAQLEFKSGLVVFTGPSGSGKSILMRSLLASVGLDSVDAAVCESCVQWEIDEEKFGIFNEENNVFRHVKKEKTSYFINNQRISKSSMELISSQHLRHLSLKDYSDFEPNALISLVDERIASHDNEHTGVVKQYSETFLQHKKQCDELAKIEESEKKLSDLKEFAQFEIAKIDAIKPIVGEDEELNSIKKQLSKKEKIQEAIDKAQGIFAYEHHIANALSLLDAPTDFIDDALNELRALFENMSEKLELLEETSIETVLDRLEQISELKRRYGGIEEALEYRNQKAIELESYQNIEHSKNALEKEIGVLAQKLEEMGTTISSKRHKEIGVLLAGLNHYLSLLYLRPCVLEIQSCEPTLLGYDKVILGLEGTKLDKLSSGEFNRLRLALLALKVETMNHAGGVLMLDEIDANLSGEESMSVARVLRHLSSRYQIFVISHQPQLTSMGDQHFLIYKDDESRVMELDNAGRIDEIARIISGDGVSEEARGFAKELFERVQKEATV